MAGDEKGLSPSPGITKWAPWKVQARARSATFTCFQSNETSGKTVLGKKGATFTLS